MQILIIDDEPNARVYLKVALENMKHKVNEADNIDAAIECLTNNAYDLIILDIMMSHPCTCLPNVPLREIGKEFLLQLRKGNLKPIKTLNNVRVVVLTAVCNMDVIETLKLHAALVLFKPLDSSDVMKELQEKGMLT